MPCFTLEIGTEELPSRFLPVIKEELHQRLGAALTAHNLEYSGLVCHTTPRRTVAIIENVAAMSQEKEETIAGPSLKAAYDVGGRPTRAAEGFARSQGVALENTFTLENEKGAYIAVVKKVGGESALTILSAVCPDVIAALPFAKRMKWGSGEFTFGRPIRWLLALLDTAVVPFTLGGVPSGNTTCGHRVHGSGPFVVASAADYPSVVLEQCKIILPGEKRRAFIVEQGDRLATEKNGRVLWKDSLLDEVQGLVEHPVPMLGSFDSSYLEVPEDVLLTSMQSHQKSFGLKDADGRLLPYFLTVLNMTPKDPALVKKGWERVLRARLEDARFFWKADLKASLETWLEMLDSVIFLAPLGSMGDKSRRVAELAGWLANSIRCKQGEQPHADDAIRAGRLCKADLVSEMVKEFDTLQGIMGGIYAERKGEDEVVAKAISEQYLPAGPDSPVPSSLVGALVSMADKADTLVGCFGLNMIPTGTADPYALRRAALGISRILLEKELVLDIDAFFAKAQEVYGERQWKLPPDQALARLREFFTLRLKNHLISSGAETLFVEAILSADATDPQSALARLRALEESSKNASFAATIGTFKRVANIIRKQAESAELTGAYDASLLVDAEEKALAEAIETLQPEFEAYWQTENYVTMFTRLAEMQPVVNAFFDAVMVMSDDMKVRENRLNLLTALLGLFAPLADFAALQM